MNAFEKISYIYDQIRLVNDEPIAKPGLSRDVIIQMFKDFDLFPVPLLVDLYEWHNGIGYLNAFLHLLSLSESLDRREDYDSNEYKVENNESKDHKQNICLLPIFSMNGDVQICVDINSGSLTAIDLELGRFEEIAEHYENYLNALLEVFESRSFIYEDFSGSIEIDKAFWLNMKQKYKIKNAY
jgi:hypothetical protein